MKVELGQQQKKREKGSLATLGREGRGEKGKERQPNCPPSLSLPLPSNLYGNGGALKERGERGGKRGEKKGGDACGGLLLTSYS